MRLRFILFGLLLPVTVVAAKSTVWDFRGGSVPGSWQVMETLEVERTADGLHIYATADGKMHRNTELTHDTDSVVLTVIAVQPTTIFIGWHPLELGPGSIVEFPVQVIGTGQPEQVQVPVHQFKKEWGDGSDLLAISYPAGSEIILQDVQLINYSPIEMIGNVIKSFWKFDRVRGYSINFLWGPLLVFTPHEIPGLFEQQPPRALSAMRVAYAVILFVGILWGLAHVLSKRKPALHQWKRKLTTAFVVVVAAMWILLDARMGSELLSYAFTDFQTYVFQEPGQRRFRDFQRFHDIVEQSMPVLMAEPKYAFIGPSDSLLSYLRYITYPSLPTLPNESLEGVQTLLVFMRPDITIDAQGNVRSGDQVIASSGSNLVRFGDDSFLYQL